jgi:hypothetical protein
MFALGADNGLRVLDAAAGPASFAAEWAAAGRCALACDPLYASDEAEIRERLAAARDAVRELLADNAQRFVWRTFSGQRELIETRLAAAERFLADFRSGRAQGRYLAAALPRLPFADRTFDLALCSHFLFLYSEAFEAEFHLAALTELMRIAKEARVFPLLAMDGKPSPHVAVVTETLRSRGCRVAIQRVGYELQRGGNEMLRLSREISRAASP